MLRQTSDRTRCAVLHHHDSHSLLIQILPDRNDLKAIGIIAGVSTSGIDDLDRRRLKDSGNMPLDVGLALVRLRIRHLAFRPDVFHRLCDTRNISREAGHDILRLLKRPEEAHLGHELYSSLKPESAVALTGIKMQLGGNTHPAKLPVDLGRAVRRIWIQTSVVQAHRAGFLVKLEHLAEIDIGAVTFAKGRCACLPVIGDVCRGIHYRPIDMARDLV